MNDFARKVEDDMQQHIDVNLADDDTIQAL
jgi:hypothetical protein